jgi:hypothetical protein
VNSHTSKVRIEPPTLGRLIATGAEDVGKAWTGISRADFRHQVDKAALLFSKVRPEEVTDDPSSPGSLLLLRQNFFAALSRDWLKSELLAAAPTDGGQHAAPHFNGFTIVNALGKTAADLAGDSSLFNTAGLKTLDQEERRLLLAEWFDEHGLDRHYNIGTIEFSLACIVRQATLRRGEKETEGLQDRTALLKAYNAEIERWQQHPQEGANPHVLAAVHLARSSGEDLGGAAMPERLQEVLTVFTDRWIANFGKPPKVFNRVEAALDILWKETGQERFELDYDEQEFTFLHPGGLPESVRVTPLDRFLELADRPGNWHTMQLRCEHDAQDWGQVRHPKIHVVNPREALERAEESYNSALATDRWVIARAKENLRLGGKELSSDAAAKEVLRISDAFKTETEHHRHLINGVQFLKDWCIGLIPVVGGIYNIAQGIRHDQVKQIIGGGFSFAFDMGGLALGARRGIMVRGSPAKVAAQEAVYHMVGELDPSPRVSDAAAPLRSTSSTTFFSAGEIGPVAEGEIFADVPPRFANVQPGAQIAYVHPETGEALTVTKIQSTGEVVALRNVPGQQNTFHAVDWINGKPRAQAELNTYNLDRGTGLIEQGRGLLGGSGRGREHAEAGSEPTGTGETNTPPETAAATTPDVPSGPRHAETAAPADVASGSRTGTAGAVADTAAGGHNPPEQLAPWHAPDRELDPTLFASVTSLGAFRWAPLGDEYVYAWMITLVPREGVDEAALVTFVNSWNVQYGDLGYGPAVIVRAPATAAAAEASKLIVVRPAIPILERSMQHAPNGHYGVPSVEVAAASAAADADIRPLHEVFDLRIDPPSIILARGIPVAGHPNVVGYKGLYWTFFRNEADAEAFKESWDGAFAARTGRYAAVAEWRPREDSYSVITAGVPDAGETAAPPAYAGPSTSARASAGAAAEHPPAPPGYAAESSMAPPPYPGSPLAGTSAANQHSVPPAVAPSLADGTSLAAEGNARPDSAPPETGHGQAAPDQDAAGGARSRSPRAAGAPAEEPIDAEETEAADDRFAPESSLSGKAPADPGGHDGQTADSQLVFHAPRAANSTAAEIRSAWDGLSSPDRFDRSLSSGGAVPDPVHDISIYADESGAEVDGVINPVLLMFTAAIRWDL